MNYLQSILSKFILNDSDSSDCEENSPNESGEFQVIEFEEDLIHDDYDKENDYTSTPSNKETIKASPKQKDENQQKLSPQKQKFQMQKQSSPPNPTPSKSQILIETNLHSSKGSASTIQIDQYYMIVSSQELTKKFTTNQQWAAFYKKINQFNDQKLISLTLNKSLTCSHTPTDKKKQKLSISLTELNSILEIKAQELQKRTEYWDKIAVPPVSIKFKHSELANKKDPQKLQKNANKIISVLVPSILEEIKSKKLKPIESVEDEMQKWRASIIKMLTLFGANDRQIGYSKGLQYIALGILVAKPLQSFKSFGQSQMKIDPHPNAQRIQTPQSEVSSPQLTDSKLSYYTQLQTHFKYLLFTKQMRNMYFPGTPKIYQEIHLLTELMRSEVPELFSKLEEIKVDFVKLFINYYKTFLLYKIKNPEVIRKIMELLLIYGIDIVRIILTRIMNRNENKILQIPEQMEFLRYLAQQLIQDYFRLSDSYEVIAKFKQLFILDIIS